MCSWNGQQALENGLRFQIVDSQHFVDRNVKQPLPLNGKGGRLSTLVEPVTNNMSFVSLVVNYL